MDIRILSRLLLSKIYANASTDLIWVVLPPFLALVMISPTKEIPRHPRSGPTTVLLQEFGMVITGRRFFQLTKSRHAGVISSAKRRTRSVDVPE
jgi:hypothetical protein